ncbi:hypothetical protein SAMN05421837_104616 [Amycolatopsis pretoriensis]|uniref:Uncharacterized protein n=1 Tax=Amycolatopsis pretoriensis TaxID=218821 RepID=A0A1H5QT43_9PSEU|nr:hypothetical protein [Amycolatopsis pretoriensis]SEF29270.1 hypothetical protein SAMN05421837_104616 [Amycolatopsis pretoriensis]
MTADLHEESVKFAQQIQDLLDAVLPMSEAEDQEVRKLKVIEHEDSYAIRPGTLQKVGAVWLTKGGDHVADLHLSYLCALDRSRGFLAVRKSKFQLTSARPKEGPPLFRLDFDNKAHTVPAAHWNVNGERGATSVLLARCNPDHVGLLSQVHLPVGGVRYRPCLEDFLDLLLTEFKFDRNPAWQDRIEDGRESWRRLQTRAIVRDSPEDAAEVLAKLGYSVTPPDSGHTATNLEALRCR